MRKFTFLILLTILFVNTLTPKIYSQDPLSYYPLQTGNVFVYNRWSNFTGCTPFFYEGTKVIKVGGDTTLSNGKTYFRIDGQFYGEEFFYQRVDTTTKNVYYYDLDSLKEYLLDSLAAHPGDSFDGHRNPHRFWTSPFVQSLDSSTFFGLERYYKVIETDGLIYMEYELVEGFGIGRILACEGGGTTYILKGCVINGIVYGDTTLTSVNNISSEIPGGFKLYNNYPNPFNPSTTIKFDIPVRGNVSLSIYNNLGKEVSTLVNTDLSPGSYETFWDASAFSSGVYFYRLETTGFTQTKRMMLIK